MCVERVKSLQAVSIQNLKVPETDKSLSSENRLSFLSLSEEGLNVP